MFHLFVFLEEKVDKADEFQIRFNFFQNTHIVSFQFSNFERKKLDLGSLQVLWNVVEEQNAKSL